MNALILMITLAFCGATQTKEDDKYSLKQSKALAAEYKKASMEFEDSLKKLLAIYERNIQKAEEKLLTINLHFNEGSVSRGQLDDATRELETAKVKAESTRKQIADIQEQIKHLPSDADIEKRHREAVAARRKAKEPICENWTLSAYRRQRKGSVVVGYKLICSR